MARSRQIPLVPALAPGHSKPKESSGNPDTFKKCPHPLHTSSHSEENLNLNRSAWATAPTPEPARSLLPPPPLSELQPHRPPATPQVSLNLAELSLLAMQKKTRTSAKYHACATARPGSLVCTWLCPCLCKALREQSGREELRTSRVVSV